MLMIEDFWKEIILTIIWGVLAFYIQPKFLEKRISAKYKDKKWVEVHLGPAHSRLLLGVEKVIEGSQLGFSEALGELIGKTFEEERKKIVSGVLGGTVGPMMKQAKAANGDVEEQLEEYLESNGVQASVEAIKAKQKYMEKIYDKYPLLAFAPEILDKISSSQSGKGGGKQLTISTGKDF